MLSISIFASLCASAISSQRRRASASASQGDVASRMGGLVSLVEEIDGKSMGYSFWFFPGFSRVKWSHQPTANLGRLFLLGSQAVPKKMKVKAIRSTESRDMSRPSRRPKIKVMDDPRRTSQYSRFWQIQQLWNHQGRVKFAFNASSCKNSGALFSTVGHNHH